jgi:dipeptidyl aminopeptidase/acylaminoacyl peptidase
VVHKENEQPRSPRAVEPEDLFRLVFLQEARLSPDARTTAYVVSHTDGEAEKETDRSAIWLVDVPSGETRQFTAGTSKDASPRWSPDGKQVAFVSSRDDKPQLYLMPVDGGEARALARLEQGVSGAPAWSPDGRTIAFTASPPGEPRDPAKPYRVRRKIFRFDGVGNVDDAVQDLYTIGVEGGEPQRLVQDDCVKASPVWSPDGSEILFSAVMLPDSHRIQPSLRVANREGEVRELLEDWGYAEAAAWTPDGKGIVFLGNPWGLPVGTQANLWVCDRQGENITCRTAGLDVQVGGGLQPDMPVFETTRSPRILVTADGKSALVQVQVGGTVAIYGVALQGPEQWWPVVAGERGCFPQDLQDGRLLFAASTLQDPMNLFVAQVDGSDERQLTQLNAEVLAEFALPAVEHLRFPGVDGTQLEGWFLKPVNGEAPCPTVLYIHGGPHSAFGHVFSFDFQMLAGAGYGVLFVNQRGSTGYGDDFANQIIGDWGNLDYQDLMSGVDEAIARGLADGDRLGCCGISGGGNLSCWIVGQTDRFKAAVPENPVTNWVSMYGVSDIGVWFSPRELGGAPHEALEVYWRCSPLAYAHRCTTPTLLIQGEQDHRCPPEQSEQFYAVLQANDCVVEMLRLPNSPHVGSIAGSPEIRRAQNEALLEWMNRYVLGVEPESDEGDESGE